MSGTELGLAASVFLACAVEAVEALTIVLGGLLLVFGLQWLRKAILRAAGLKARHDETAAYERESQAARSAARAPGFDPYAFTVAFKGVLLEGLEVAFIVLTFGANQHHIALAALAAALAITLVVLTSAREACAEDDAAIAAACASCSGSGPRQVRAVRRRV